MTTSTSFNVNRRMIIRVFHNGPYSEGAQVISYDDDQLGRRPDELDVPKLNHLLQYWRDFGEQVEWCASNTAVSSFASRQQSAWMGLTSLVILRVNHELAAGTIVRAYHLEDAGLLRRWESTPHLTGQLGDDDWQWRPRCARRCRVPIPWPGPSIAPASLPCD